VVMVVVMVVVVVVVVAGIGGEQAALGSDREEGIAALCRGSFLPPILLNATTAATTTTTSTTATTATITITASWSAFLCPP